MEKGRYEKAFESMRRLRFSPVQAARDMYYAHKLLEVESEQRSKRQSTFKELFFVRRNRRAAQSSFFVMFMQQFCGVNVIGKPTCVHFFTLYSNCTNFMCFQL